MRNLFEGHCVKSVQVRSFFWPVFSRIRTEYGETRSNSVRMPENTDQKKLTNTKQVSQRTKKIQKKKIIMVLAKQHSSSDM